MICKQTIATRRSRRTYLKPSTFTPTMQVQFNRKFYRTIFLVILLLNLDLVSSKRQRSKTRKNSYSSRISTRLKCKKIANLKIHSKILEDFSSPRELTFIKQQIRHFQENSTCQNLIKPNTFLNLLYYHSSGHFSLECVKQVFTKTGYSSNCLSQLLQNTRKYSKKRSYFGSHLLDIINVKLRKLNLNMKRYAKINGQI